MKGNKNQVLREIKESIIEIANIEDVNKLINEALKSGIDPIDIINTLNEALEEVGKKYENGEYFLAELMMAGYLASQIVAALKPYLVKIRRETLGKIVFGTVKGDIHDIGKNIVIMMLQAAGFEVIDLGVDVPAEKFIDALINEGANVLCMSALLTSTMYEIKNVIDTLKRNNLRDKVKIVIGGRPITKDFANEVGADGYAEDAVKAVKVIKELIGIKEV
ncbi:MAG: corrinoid protein [Candidatus Methanomethylicaceae archaeon]